MAQTQDMNRVRVAIRGTGRSVIKPKREKKKILNINYSTHLRRPVNVTETPR